MTIKDSFAINGRYLSQPVTGVQRYAFNVTDNIGKILLESGQTAPLITPSGSIDPKLEGIRHYTVGKFKRHIWEQIDLPLAWQGKLLNLCNTAPALKRDQIVCMHDANVYLAPESYEYKFRALYKILQPLIAQRAAQITTVSEYSAVQIAKLLSLKAKNIVVLPNGHEHVRNWDAVHAIVAPRALEQRASIDRPFILALGSRAKHKNLELLLNISSKIEEMGIDIVFAGGSSDIFANQNLRQRSNLFQLGFVTDHDLAYLFQRALCLAFPSLTEGFGLPVLEAMACGCPVLSSNRASLPEICGSAALLVAPDAPEEWLLNIQLLRKSSSLRDDLIGRGREQATKFSWTTTSQGYLELLRRPYGGDLGRGRRLRQEPRVAVIIATLGRAQTVQETIRRIIDNQNYKNTILLISCTRLEDAGEAANWPNVRVILGPAGLARQRNSALEAISDEVDIVVFFDDDFVPSPDWLSVAVATFLQASDVVGFTGDVVADGIKGPGLNFEDVDSMLKSLEPAMKMPLIEPFSPYGCNMAFRRSAIGSLRFDESLILYGWLEDRDFGAALASRGGRLVKNLAARGVHMGVKGGRMAGGRLGYSQVANPLYMVRKGTMNFNQAMAQILRNVASNIVKSFAPEPFVDRRGRLYGNFCALIDLILGRLKPERAMNVKVNKDLGKSLINRR